MLPSPPHSGRPRAVAFVLLVMMVLAAGTPFFSLHDDDVIRSGTRTYLHKVSLVAEYPPNRKRIRSQRRVVVKGTPDAPLHVEVVTARARGAHLIVEFGAKRLVTTIRRRTMVFKLPAVGSWKEQLTLQLTTPRGARETLSLVD
jgi:hypothetical protein